MALESGMNPNPASSARRREIIPGLHTDGANLDKIHSPFLSHGRRNSPLAKTPICRISLPRQAVAHFRPPTPLSRNSQNNSQSIANNSTNSLIFVHPRAQIRSGFYEVSTLLVRHKDPIY